ncbi:S41 family peptidase [Flavobacterium sp. SM15]|uniref:S41 family peptidase n=1 Tax=Flavobacterium sp. SM15 TaxID=2908005 RepID=UPI001EDB63F1|nr:S41 family peptidase [Flavobacterium sp. SM15]MCG2612316.1 S41 family peptidase [Flavobacterium sp. SM15]
MRQLLIIFSFTLFQLSFSQSKVTENSKTESLIHIWGLLKYQHPEVSKGIFDFNQEFINEFDKISPIQTTEALNTEFLNWVRKFDLGKSKFKNEPNLLNNSKIFTKNADFSWIENSGFNQELIQELNRIKSNRAIGDYYASINSLNKMVNFKNEKGYDRFDPAQKAHRFLFLSSFWNTMRYWNVNIYLTDQPWREVLTEMIPVFNQESTIKFESAKEQLFSKLNDSHSNYDSSHLLNKKLINYAYFGGRIINDSLVITSIFNTDFAKKDGISLGDVVYTVEEKPLKNYYVDKFSQAISVSNQNYLKSRIERFFLLANDKDSIQIGIKKNNGSKTTKTIKLYKSVRYPEDLLVSMNKPLSENWFKIKEDIGYLNLKLIDKSGLKKAFKEFDKTKAIIIDLRNYPRNISTEEIAEHLYPDKKVFIKTLGPFTPSYAEYDIEAPLKIIKNPFACGSKNKDYYKGKIVLLVDRTTSSNAEFIGMAIQQAPNCITLGEQTFGAVMNRNQITLIDKTTIDFTGMGAFYPNDKSVQRNGLNIDYPINESAANYNPDLYLEEAVKLIQK